MKLDLDGFSLSEEDVILFRSISDKISLSEKHFSPKFTFFLNENQCELVEMVLKKSGYEDYILYGGYDNAKRKVLAVAPPYRYANFPEFPIRAVTITYREADSLSHRDVLGSLMSYNIERKTVGDIIIGDGRSNVFLYETVADEVMLNLRKIGRTGVKISEGYDGTIIPEEKFKEISGTVASLRLDCVLSLALNLSREKAVAVIKNNGVVVNFKEQFSPSFQLNKDDIFSVRGYGKFVFASVNGISKKERIHITVKKYL